MSTTELAILSACGIMVIGYFIGKIKLGGVSLDFAAVLIFAVLFGALASRWKPDIIQQEWLLCMETFSKFGSALFMASIGVSAGITFKKNFEWKYFSYFLLGALMTLIGFASMNIISLLDPEFDRSLLIGILCGALTSTPGLATASELESVDVNQAAIGYGYAYLFGVLFIVLFVQFFQKKKCAIMEPTEQHGKASPTTVYGWILLMMIVALGYALANVKMPLFGVSLGKSCSVLCAGMIAGFATKKRAKIGDLSLYRNMGLLLFFVGTGVPTGLKLNGFFNVKAILYGMLLTVVTLVAGYLLCRIKADSLTALCAVSGGMTSTPALGVLMDKCLVDLRIYSFAYVGALLMMVMLFSF